MAESEVPPPLPVKAQPSAETPQGHPIQEPNITESPQRKSRWDLTVADKYPNLLKVSETLSSHGTFLKGVGWLLGGAGTIGLCVAFSKAVDGALAIGVSVIFISLGLMFHWAGIMNAAAGEVLMATADTALASWQTAQAHRPIGPDRSDPSRGDGFPQQPDGSGGVAIDSRRG